MVQIILAARGRITTHFHQDIGRGFLHRGIDQGHGDGNAVDLEIRAPADGVITYAGVFGSYGLCIFIRHDDSWVSVLAHHKSHLVSKGDRVTQGQIIAVMGNSGTKYVHSHQELRDAKGNQIDPLLHLSTASSTASSTTTPAEEDDMYDAAAQAALFEKIEAESRPVKLYTEGTGVIALGRGGSFWIIPNQDYIVLLEYLGLAHPTSVPVNTAQWEFLRTISGVLNPDPQVTAAVTSVVGLSAAAVKDLAAQIGERQVVVSDVQIAAIVAAAKSGAELGVSGLSFITTVK